MKIYKLEVYVYDFEEQSVNDVINELQKNKYYSVQVADYDIRTINNWTDDHPANQCNWLEFLRNLFSRAE